MLIAHSSSAMFEGICKNPNVNVVFLFIPGSPAIRVRALDAFDVDRLGVVSVSVCSPNIDCSTAAGRSARRQELSKAEDSSDQHSERSNRQEGGSHRRVAAGSDRLCLVTITSEYQRVKPTSLPLSQQPR